MKLGLGLPNLGLGGNRANLLALAREAELLHYDSLWAAERLMCPTEPRQLPGGTAWPDAYKTSLDTLETLTFVAAVTENIRLGTSVLNVPFYQPLHLAKRMATLDVLSNGRTVFGIAQGWSEDEYEASGIPFSERTGRLVEIIQALDVLWGADPVEFHGKYFHVPSTSFDPKPVQTPRPALLMASMAPASIARAARLTDGFNPVASPVAAENEAILQAELQAWHDAGRGPALPQIVMRVNYLTVTDQPLADDRMFLTGSVEQIRQDVQQLETWGATELFFQASRLMFGEADGLRLQLEDMAKLRSAFV